MEEYDVIIAGAGPAGSNCAKELSDNGYNILLIDSNTEIGKINFSTAGTPNETMKIFNLPKKVTDSPWSSMFFAGPNENYEFNFEKIMGYVLNYKLLTQFLVKKAKRNGAEIRTETIAENVITKNGFICGLKIKEKEAVKKVFGRVVIDATGGKSALAKKLDIIKCKDKPIVAVEYHMKNVKLEKSNRLEFYIGSKYAPGGYAWIFPSGKTKAKVGVGIIKWDKTSKKPIELLEKFVAGNKETMSAVRTDLHGGSMYANGGIKNHVRNGFLVIGDAAGQINPIAGEGIRHALHSGAFAAQSISMALRKGDSSENMLKSYNQKWNDYAGEKWRISYIIQQMLYSFSDKKYDAIIRLLPHVSKEDAFEISFNYRFKIFRKYLPLILKVVSIGNIAAWGS